jgi:hypothetical protein
MAEDVKKEEEKKEEKKEKKELKLDKRKAVIVGRFLLGAGLLTSVGFAAYSIGKGHGSDSAYADVYRKFPEIREALKEIDPAFFASIVL